MLDPDDDALLAFLEESREQIQTLEQNLLSLESGGGVDGGVINAVFRAVHTIKGTAAFFAVPIKDLAHVMEDVLGKIRAGEMPCTADTITVLLDGTSRLGQMIHEIDRLDTIPTADVIQRLQRILDGHGAEPASATSRPEISEVAISGAGVNFLDFQGNVAFSVPVSRVHEAQRAPTGGRYLHYLEIDEVRVGDLRAIAEVIDRRMIEPVGLGRQAVAVATVLEAELLGQFLWGVPGGVRAIDDRHFGGAPVSAPAPAHPPAMSVPSYAPAPVPASAPVAASSSAPSAPSAVPSAPSAVEDAKGGGEGAIKAAAEGAGTIRVNVHQLDRLMALAGELVLTRNALLKKASERDLDEMIELTERVDVITSDLQDGIMATRMQQVGLVFTKFRRILRDLSVKLNKKVDLDIEGEEVELDKTIIEAIGDPLAHLVRNSVDHGIEAPAERLRIGKNERGRLSLRALHQAGQVIIEVSDDGRGIDPRKVAAKAIEKRLHTRDEIDAMTDSEVIRLIFKPGFSTAEAVTEVSGRGVGMDVVLSSLTKVGGTVDIQSEVGRGSTITVRLPLTLAIIPSILVATHGERFAIPQVNLVELVRIPAREVQKRLERVGTASVMRLRGEILPLLRLSDALSAERVFLDPRTAERRADRRVSIADRRSAEVGQDAKDDNRRTGDDRRNLTRQAVNIAVVAAGSFRYGLVVDQLLDSEEIVVKPLGSHLRGCREYAGATILGDGTVALILDVAGLSQAANLSSTKSMIDAAESRRRNGRTSDDTQAHLVFENARDELFAIPLGLVSRIERIPEAALQHIGGRRTATFGQSILALVALEDVSRVNPRAAGRHFYAIVCRTWGREVGVMASRVVDVIESSAVIDDATHVQAGVLGSAVVEGKLLLVVDVHGLVGAVLPEYKRPPKTGAGAKGSAVLVVEDSSFFRKQIVACLTDAGYRTVVAEDGELGLLALEQNAEDIGLIITDIEMPKMDGLEMSRKIRLENKYRKLPIVACTSLSGEVAERRGKEAGIDEYLIKLDREQIVDRANHYLRTKNIAATSGLRRPTQGAEP